MSEISFGRQGSTTRTGRLLSSVLKIMMQIALTPNHPVKNDCFAGDAVEDLKETDIPLSSGSIGRRPLCNLRLADDIDLLGDSEKEELQQLNLQRS